MTDYLETAGRHSSTSVVLPELGWQAYADRVRKFSAQYRKRVDGHVTSTMSQWRAKVGPLAENDWLTFAVKLFDISTRQVTTRNYSERQSIDLDVAKFLQLLDVDSVLAWNATLIARSH